MEDIFSDTALICLSLCGAISSFPAPSPSPHLSLSLSLCLLARSSFPPLSLGCVPAHVALHIHVHAPPPFGPFRLFTRCCSAGCCLCHVDCCSRRCFRPLCLLPPSLRSSRSSCRHSAIADSGQEGDANASTFRCRLRSPLLRRAMSRYDIASEPTAETLALNYKAVCDTVAQESGNRRVTLIAVSKTKSPACLLNLYNLGQRVFGENYVQELGEKAKELPEDTVWHFIGHLQSNKVKELLEGVPNLRVVQTIDSENLASKVNEGCRKYRGGRPLEVYIQVNTSGEETKSGTEPGEATVTLAKYIADECPLLQLKGLMTIGMPDYTSRPENFECLTKCREDVAQPVQMAPEDLELSMGMSGDYVNAIRMGSTAVRVGTSIFGQRYYPHKQ
nr:conserved hypothetical protein [imported] - Leishmania major [Leishmania major]